MNKPIHFLCFLFLLTIPFVGLASDNYQKIVLDEHKIFKYEFNLDEYKLKHTRALDDGKLSLETVLSCAKRNNAVAAFNGGFFYTGYRKTGLPVWLFINKTNIFAHNLDKQDGMYVTDDNSIHFEKLSAEISLAHGRQKTQLASINNPVVSGIKVFTVNYWTSTLTDPGTFEIIVKSGTVADINTKGNNRIPENGFVISAADNVEKEKLSQITLGDKIGYDIKITAGHKKLDLSKVTAITNGSDFLVKNSKIPNNIAKGKGSDFSDTPHARTVLCQFDKKRYAVFIVDHNPAKKAYDMKIRDLIMPLKERGLTRELALKTPAGELLEGFDKLGNKDDLSIGITLPKLAMFLKKQGCINALNLDGGGSSTLVVNNKVVNNPTGLQNIDIEEKNIREVGDIFLITK